MKDILLITMPWNALDMPSLQLGILSSVLAQTHPDLKCNVLYGNLLWAEYLLNQSGGKVIRADDYPMIAEQSFGYGVGEWIFTPALYDSPPDPAEYLRYIGEAGLFTPQDLETIQWMYTQAKPFIQWLIAEKISDSYRMVGFTSTFMQNVPSLALAKAMKEMSPSTQIVFGGANCEGPQGAALHRNFSWLDFVVRGEGERTFPALVEQVFRNQSRDLDSISQLCWRSPTGDSVVNPALGGLVDMGAVPLPDYEAYFSTLENIQVAEYIQPELPLESSRGCWWGAKSHCLFCGLNGNTMAFRSKSADQVFSELVTAATRYKTLDLFMVDNIMDIKYMEQLLPRLRDQNWDFNLFYEVKANLKEEHIRLFSEAGVRRIQPGIESLSSSVLKIMRKGVTGAQNVQLLAWCEQYNVEVSWNILYGFPGETADDYAQMLSQIHLLHHLQPPDVAVRIMLERFSPYFADPSLGLRAMGPAMFYGLVYNLPFEELMDLAYIFESAPAGITEKVAEPLKTAIAEWQEAYLSSAFSYRLGPRGSLHLFDTRPRRSFQDYAITDRTLVTAYLDLKTARSPEDLRIRVYDRTGDRRLVAGSDYMVRWCREMSELGLLYRSDSKYLALAIPDEPGRVRMAKVEAKTGHASDSSTVPA